METVVAASLLSADFSYLADEIDSVQKAGADWLHYDVMDGLFVPSISFGEPVLKSIADKVKIPIDVHLMIIDPCKYLKNYADLGANTITVHYETVRGVKAVMEKIRSLGCKAGISVKPDTDVRLLEPYLQYIDMILVMTVEPGFGGQAFMTDMLDKIRIARQMIDKSKLNIRLEVDGGINEKTASLVREYGADTIVTGSYLFKAQNKPAAISLLKGK